MKIKAFATRNAKELIRDPLNIAFSIGFPVVLLVMLSAIQANIPVSLFEIQNLTPGIAVFGLSFITLFSATLISKDRGSSFLCRLYTTPMTAWDFIFGYTLPLIPIAVAQSIICYVIALFLGLDFSVNILFAIIFIIPVSVMYIAMGLLFGSLLTDKQAGGVCGALLTNLSAWLSGVWFDIELVGGVFKTIADMLPFIHACEMGKAVLSGNFSGIFPHIWWVLGYTVVLSVFAVFAFNKQMKNC